MEAIVDEYDRKKVAMLLEETNKLLSKSESSSTSADVEPVTQYDDAGSEMMPPYSNTSSNISNSSLAVAAIVAVIAFLLFRRIFLLGHVEVEWSRILFLFFTIIVGWISPVASVWINIRPLQYM